MPGLHSIGGGGIFYDQILFHRKSRLPGTRKYSVCGIILEKKVISLHKIEVVKISSFLLNNSDPINTDWLLTYR